MTDGPRRYVSDDEDSARWQGFPFRDGDIVISTRSKSGTTWMQMICALLVFGTPDLPRPLGELSPWLDHLVVPKEEVFALLAEQKHRRVIKTHTPLDGVPLDPRVTYIVVARHPVDVGVSVYHQIGNIDHERMRQLVGVRPPTTPPPPRPSEREWLVSWLASRADPLTELDSLPGLFWHLSDAWSRRDASNVLLVHYADLSADLEGEMRDLATRLGVDLAPAIWPELVRAATFASMRNKAEDLAPDRSGVLKDRTAFFRRGRSGAGRELLTEEEYAAYLERAAELGSPELLAWLHR